MKRSGRQFGRILKEGVHFDFENKDTLAQLMRFNSSTCKSPDELLSLKEYIDRMKLRPERGLLHNGGKP